MVTRKDVAVLAGVSVTAVSRVVNNSGYVAEKKRAAILKAIEEVGYRPSPVAMAAQKRFTYQLLFYNKDLSNGFTIEMYRGMVDYAALHGFMVLLSGTWDISKIRAMQVDGIIFPNEVILQVYSQTIDNRMFLPIVCASYGTSQKRPKRIPLIESDTHAAMELLIDYLFEKGHTQIAFATPIPVDSGNSRGIAYTNKLLPIHGKEINDYIFVSDMSPLQFRLHEEDYYQSGEQIASEILASDKTITAVICFNDKLAMGMINYFNRVGVRVPQDISVAGIDGLDIGSYTHPKLTTVSLSAFEQGCECVRTLIGLISGEKVKTRTSIPIRLIERESVADLKACVTPQVAEAGSGS